MNAIGSWRYVIRLLVFVALAIVGASPTAAQTDPWIRHLAGNHGVIVFVHGVMGDDRSTWTAGSAYWTEMLTHDAAFDGEDVYVYRYPSARLDRTFSIDEVAENMRLVLTTDGVLQHDELTFSKERYVIVALVNVGGYSSRWPH